HFVVKVYYPVIRSRKSPSFGASLSFFILSLLILGCVRLKKNYNISLGPNEI
ncbi:hypothetical protein FWK35_00003424, partial [Aphis craccivora]